MQSLNSGNSFLAMTDQAGQQLVLTIELDSLTKSLRPIENVRLTPDGVQYLNEFTEAWQNASDTVNRILHDKEG